MTGPRIVSVVTDSIMKDGGVTFAFIRHGQTDWNRDDKLQGSSDIPLNELGRRQAREAAAALAEGDWHAVVSSPLRRARETAEVIASELGIDLGPSYPDFVERNYGPLEGTSSSETLARWPHRDYPGAESLESVVRRGLAGLANLWSDFGGRDVVIVCHGTIIRYTLAALAAHPIDGIRNGSISTVERVGDSWEVVTVNGVPVSAPSRLAPDPRGIAG
ncbi:histidine phosphatase family protein [soil metagenome]